MNDGTKFGGWRFGKEAKSGVVVAEMRRDGRLSWIWQGVWSSRLKYDVSFVDLVLEINERTVPLTQ